MFCTELISAVIRLSDDAAAKDIKALVSSLLAQKRVKLEVVVADARAKAAPVPGDDGSGRVTVVRTKAKSRAKALAAAIAKAKGKMLLITDNEGIGMTFRESAAETMVLAMRREKGVSMVYCDYERKEGRKKTEVRLLGHHAGRLRDFQDFGRVFLVDAAALRRAGGIDSKLNAGDLYDLRLKMSEKGEVRHITNRYAGSLYTVEAAGAGHDVFAYLLATKATQLEVEAVITEHLKRLGAYLKPGSHQAKVKYTKKELEAFKDCLVSVVVPVNNRPEFIQPAVESIQAQTDKRCEAVIVVNGGENDPTCKAVREYMEGGKKYNPKKPKVRLVVTDVNNLGLCLNTGIHEGRGKYYLQLDSDDQLNPNAVKEVVKVFESDPKIGMVVGSYEVWEKKANGKFVQRKDIPVVTHDEWTEANGRNNLLRINGAGAPRAIHRKVLFEVGGFGCNDEHNSRNYGEDYDLVLRVSEKHRIGRVWKSIYRVIRHSGGTDHSIDQVTIDRNDDTKDSMRRAAIERRIKLNKAAKRKSR